MKFIKLLVWDMHVSKNILRILLLAFKDCHFNSKVEDFFYLKEIQNRNCVCYSKYSILLK